VFIMLLVADSDAIERLDDSSADDDVLLELEMALLEDTTLVKLDRLEDMIDKLDETSAELVPLLLVNTELESDGELVAMPVEVDALLLVEITVEEIAGELDPLLLTPVVLEEGLELSEMLGPNTMFVDDEIIELEVVEIDERLLSKVEEVDELIEF
jgi:hypothetical protein